MNRDADTRSRSFHRQDQLSVWVEYDDSGLTFYGQDLSGYANTVEYEYWISVSAGDLRKALGGNGNEDLGDLVCQRAEEIMFRGETWWLRDHGVAFEFTNRHEFDDDR